MSSNDLTGNATSAGIAWANATKDAGNYIDSLMNQYGWTMPDASGNYTTYAAGDAFDPNNVMSFDSKGNAVYDPSKAMTGGGRIGAKGVFSDILRGGGAEEAQVAEQARSRGIMQGGLAQQARQLAEDLAKKKTGQASGELFNAIFGQYGNVAGAYDTLTQQQVLDAITGAQTGSQYV